MSTSGSISYNLTASQIVEKAFHVLGKAAEGEDLSPRMLEDGLSSLNLLFKTLGAFVHLWTKTERALTLVASTAGYALTPKPNRVLSVRWRTASAGFQMYEMSRSDYYAQSVRSLTEGTPIGWYYDPQATTGTLSVWPTPSSGIAGTTTLNITYLRRIEDVVATNDDMDMPQEWLETVVWNLANTLESEYPVNDQRLAGKIEQRASSTLALLTGWDQDPVVPINERAQK